MTATKEQALQLMAVCMPPFEQYLDHASSLQNECASVKELDASQIALFDQYRAELRAARGEYEDAVCALITTHFSAEEIAELIPFYAGPLAKTVEKLVGLSMTVGEIGNTWQNNVHERCPDTYRMIMSFVGQWMRVNAPHPYELVDGPPNNWNPVEKKAEEYVPPSDGGNAA